MKYIIENKKKAPTYVAQSVRRYYFNIITIFALFLFLPNNYYNIKYYSNIVNNNNNNYIDIKIISHGGGRAVFNDADERKKRMKRTEPELRRH